MNRARECHNEAMDIWGTAAVNCQRAAVLEMEAARLIPKEQELTRSVFFQSAATLCAHTGMLDEAEALIAEAREGNVPPEIEERLEYVEEMVALYRRMKA